MHKNKVFMWYKVKELQESGLNVSQIHKETGLDRATVRKYLTISEKAFHDWISRPRRLPKKLGIYYNFVKEQLVDQPFLSAAQIEDRLQEKYQDMPEVHSKTIFNFVKNIRLDHSLLKKPETEIRDYQKLAETAYGDEAQVDFGQGLMQTDTEYKMRVYFFAIVLSRSRQKFVYFQNFPFTTATAVYAHELAFEYFNGIPKKIIYDQDRVFITEENLGDVLLTDGFRAFCDSNPFKPVFCRKADPESKGKIENVVKYVKQNFMRGRMYKTVPLLQKECLEWLKRRANGKVHGTTGKIPHKEWLIEQPHLQGLVTAAALPKTMLPEYIVRKDNCITYKGNYYSLPSATYKGQGTKVLLEVKGSILCLYNTAKERLVQHVISQEKGCLVRSEGHTRAKSVKKEETEKQVLAQLSHPHAQQYLLALQQDKPRYYHDNLKAIQRSLQNTSKQIISDAVGVCLEKSIYNGKGFAQVVSLYKQQSPQLSTHEADKLSERASVYQQKDMTPEISNINFYESILN